MSALRARIRSLAIILAGVALMLGVVPAAPAGADAPYSVTLAASATSLPVGATVQLTATANQDIGPTPYFITIFNGDGVLVSSCGGGSTCGGAGSIPGGIAGSVTFTAYISGTNSPTGSVVPLNTIQATSNSVTVTFGSTTTTTPTYSVTLAASATSVPVGTSVTLTATANQDVGPTPYYITIFNSGNGVRLGSCGSGSTCTVTAWTQIAQSDTFTAYISGSTGGTIQATSNSVRVTWSGSTTTTTRPTTTTTRPTTTTTRPTTTTTRPTGHSVTLSASATSAPVGTAVTLTARSRVDVGPTPLYIQILDNGAQVASCGSGTSCTYSARPSQAGTRTYTARIANSGGTGSQATSNTVTVTWTAAGSTTTTTRPTGHSVTLSASARSAPVGTAVTLTARSAVDVGPTPLYIQILDNGAQVASCGSGTSCTYSARPSQAGTRTYTARIANSGGTGSQATSNTVTVTWTAAGSTTTTTRPTTTTTTRPTPPATGGSGWSATAVQYRGMNGSRFSYTCPAASSAGSPATFVWGTDVYTDDSSVCTAAVHVGLITLAQGGTTVIEIRAGQSSYQGSARNGITTLSWGSWSGSFVVVG